MLIDCVVSGGSDMMFLMVVSFSDVMVMNGLGNNFYFFGCGDGVIMVLFYVDFNFGKVNMLQFKIGVVFVDVSVMCVVDSQVGGNVVLVLMINGIVDVIIFNGFLYGGMLVNQFNGLQQVVFGDCIVWDVLQFFFLFGMGMVGNDMLSGGLGVDLLNGVDGNDMLVGSGGGDMFYGGVGMDSFDGGSGDDIFDGGVGNDMFQGGIGNNIYLFGIGSGQDVVVNQFDNIVDKLNVL